MKDLLTVGQLDLFARSAGGAADFVVVDVRGAPAATRAHRRAWAIRGWRLVAVAPASVTAAELAGSRLPIVAVRADAGDAPPLLPALYEAAEDVRAFVRSPDGRLSLGGEAQVVDALSSPASVSATLVLSLDREERVVPLELPCELALELDDAPDATHVIGLRLEGGSMAAAGWWRVEGSGRVAMRVDLAPSRDGDRWRVSATPGRVARAERPGAGPETPQPPGRLAVILDRTCPDEEGWSGARALGVAGRARVADPFAKTATDSGSHRDYNRAVRAGLERGLAEELSGHDVLVDAWAFADVPGDGLAPLEGIDHPDSTVQSLGSTPAARCAGRFAAATYAPGLDVWDPVEEALEQALDALSADRMRRGAVLILGNSPPQVLPSPGTPFAELARAAGCATATRRWSPTWELALERCRAEGVRVAYAFLEHNVFRTDEQREHEIYSRLARRVREGLEAGLPLTRGPASEEGTRRAVGEALALLRTTPVRPCGVRLARRSP